jgi:hypothetical protein
MLCDDVDASIAAATPSANIGLPLEEASLSAALRGTPTDERPRHQKLLIARTASELGSFACYVLYQ